MIVFRRRYYELLLYALQLALLAVALNCCLYGSVATFTKPFYWEKTLHGISKLAKANLQVPAQSKQEQPFRDFTSSVDTLWRL